MNRNQVRGNITVANVINSVYTALLCLMGILIGIAIKHSQAAIASLMDSAGRADADSYMGGYQLIGGLFGAGAVAVVVGVLYVFLAVSIFYLVMFLVDNIKGYRIGSRLKTEAYSEALVKKIKRNAIFKCVLACLVLIPGVCFVCSSQWFGMLVLIVPQGIVLVLAVNIIRMLPKSEDLIEPRISMGERK